ncbi:MAG: chromosome partitioning protein [Pseudoalteromonas tetraodonis]
MKIRVVFNQKGGVGKSTITCNLAAISAARGLKTLMVDLDPQCNATQYLLSSSDTLAEKTVADYFALQLKGRLTPGAKKGIEEFATATPFENLDIIAADPALDELQVKLEARAKIYKLRDALKKIKGYDAVYIDTPPALHFFTRSALIAATGCIIPFDCDDFARQALYNVMETVDEIREDHNEDLEIEGIVVNQFQGRSNLPQRLVAELLEEGLPVLNTKLSSSIVVKESHDKSVPLIHHSPKHKLTEAFVALYDELDT